MKIYFAKYFPVEGEPDNGDMVISPDGKITKVVLSEITYPEDYTIGGANLAKLFLCSKDIKIGDKVKLLEGSNNDYDIKFEDEIGNDLWFKVIGELSPDAIWVKEGDEFNEEEWSLFGYKQGMIFPDGILKNPEYQAKYKKDYIHLFVKIKCPTCNTFH